MLPLVLLSAHFRIAVALHGGLCRLSAGPVTALSPSDFQREADVCDNCNQVLVSLLLLRCGRLNLKRKQMFHNLLGRDCFSFSSVATSSKT